jgi:hydrocephalus-inducing protein
MVYYKSQMSAEISLNPESGVIGPYSTCPVSISFTAIVENNFRVTPPKLIIEYNDNEGGMDLEPKNIPVLISAEAYNVSTLCSFSDQDSNGALNFGDLKVGSTMAKTYKLKNTGKYSIDFDYIFRKKATEEFLKVEPRSGTLTPGQETSITCTFSSTREIAFKDNKDIRCQIIDSETKELVKDFDTTISVASHFDKFRLQPLKGINFGAVHYGEEKSKKFELKNNGLFDFDFRIVPLSVALKEKEDKDKGVVVPPWKATTDPLVIGQYKVVPAGGKVSPGQTVSLQILFAAKGAEVYRQTLRIDLSNRDPRGSDAGMQYEIVGESCIPGINASDYDGIFEEQQIVREIGEIKTTAYALDEKTFSFGYVIPTSRPNGVQQRFKISNPFKVRALVKYSIESRNDKEKDIFTLQPSSDDIPPHEYRYVTIYFKPNAVQKYQALFKALVDNGTDSRTNKLDWPGKMASEILRGKIKSIFQDVLSILILMVKLTLQNLYSFIILNTIYILS